MDKDHKYRKQTHKRSQSGAPETQGFKKMDLITLENEEEEAFNLNPQQQLLHNNPRSRSDNAENFSFNKMDRQRKRSDSLITKPTKATPDAFAANDDSSRGKVTIQIDWDYIIDKYIKNTNTNVMEANKSPKTTSEITKADQHMDYEDY